MLATANMVPDLPVIPNTTNVSGDIGRQSLRVASLIHEYTKLSLAGDWAPLSLVKIQVKQFFFFFSQSELSKTESAILNYVLMHAEEIAPLWKTSFSVESILIQTYKWRLACNKMVLFTWLLLPFVWSIRDGHRTNAESNKGWQIRCVWIAFFHKLIIICFIYPAEKIRQWLAAPDSSRNQNEARDKRQVDTCTWFFEGERFRAWRKNPGFLWVKGKRKFLRSSILNLNVQRL